ncbi:preprotein translocase subunit SecG [Alcaligenaceae bacterium]|nr:preprotein translocase subunit SecG [Alcaligenaceae bacterium]
MQWLSPVLLSIQVISSLTVIVLVLLQQGKGADMGSSFGGGSAGSLFGATGAANFLSRATKWAAIIFFTSTVGLAYVAHHPGPSILDGGIMQGFQPAPVPSVTGDAVPAVPGAETGTVVPAAPNTAASESAVPAVPTAPAQNSPAAVPEAPAAQ